MPKIAVTSNTSWYLYNFRKNTILALLDNGFEVFAIAPRDQYSKKIEQLGVNFIHINIDQGGTNPILDFKTLLSFIHFFSKNKVDVVLNFTPKNNIYSTLAAKIFGVKTINNIAGLGSIFINENFTAKIVRFLYKLSQTYADKIFFQNEDDREIFILNGIAKKEVTERLPGSGADLIRFNLVPAANDGITRFLLVARMLYNKGVVHYVEAARTLKSKYGSAVEFNLLGYLDVNNPSAITSQQMQSWVNEGIVNYLGTTDNVECEIGKSDCVVLPSFYREGVPKSLLEAGAMGKPIITTDNVGCRETVDHGINGFLCKPRDTSSLVKKLEIIISMSHEERLKMGINSRKKVEREFDEKIVISKYLTAINSLINNS